MIFPHTFTSSVLLCDTSLLLRCSRVPLSRSLVLSAEQTIPLSLNHSEESSTFFWIFNCKSFGSLSLTTSESSSAYRILSPTSEQAGRSFSKIIKSNPPNTDPCGTATSPISSGLLCLASTWTTCFLPDRYDLRN